MIRLAYIRPSPLTISTKFASSFCPTSPDFFRVELEAQDTAPLYGRIERHTVIRHGEHIGGIGGFAGVRMNEIHIRLLRQPLKQRARLGRGQAVPAHMGDF